MSLLHNDIRGIFNHSGDDFVVDVLGQVQARTLRDTEVSLKGHDANGGYSFALMPDGEKETSEW